MTRQHILDNYFVSQQGIIQSPGKFEGQMLYVPYFWEKCLDGQSDIDIDNVYGIEVLNADTAEFPELEGINTLALEESESGFVSATEYQSLAILERDLEESEEDDTTEIHYASFDRFTIEMSLEDAESASHQGQCDEDVEALVRSERIASQLAKISDDDLVAELKEYGTWTTEELADRCANENRIVWIAAGNITEESR
jgi:hypothetical protein